MAKEFLIARNPDDDSALPYLLLIPLDNGIVLKTKETWPRTGKLYCHRAEWVVDPEIVERVPVRSVVRRGAAIDLVLDRGRENRSQFVMTRVRGGREAVFWQTARVAKQARPQVVFPTARASGVAGMEIIVDSHERYAWKFSDQQASTVKRGLPAGDYAVEADGEVVAAVERKNLADLVGGLTGGKLRYQLSDLAGLPRAAVVVEDRYSSVFKLDFVRPAVVADALGECQARFPQVPIIFAENRALAQEWTYRFFGAALSEHAQESESVRRVAELSVPSESPEAT
ncbi:ERCC4 domain-containing protein [Ammonicoccus fulvus]|uniref:ERCC4 domain-containing protein n=1 Tax=Ammonicoccus fulvus TaxID=3138240 RepID=A0ABZ3FUD8_9ACTN